MDQQADVTGALLALHASDAPIRSGYLQGVATWNRWDGPAGRLEAGEKISKDWTAFGAATLDSRGPGAEIGVRWDW